MAVLGFGVKLSLVCSGVLGLRGIWVLGLWGSRVSFCFRASGHQGFGHLPTSESIMTSGGAALLGGSWVVISGFFQSPA